MAVNGVPSKRKEIYKYEAPWPLYSMNWSVRPDKRFRLALGSFVEEYNNKVQVVSLDEDTSEFSAKSTFDHPYPNTKIMWIPDSKGVFPDLLATSGDYLRVDPNLIGTSSIDTTCTIWGLETGQVLGHVNLVTGHVKTQLIAHDKEVFDIAFSRASGGRDMFASVGADGSSTLPLLAWNKQYPNYLATVAMDACEVIILDERVPCTPVARLNNHRACVNGIAWAPDSSCHICTAGYDHQALIWDIQQMPRAIEDPILAYTAAEGEINQIQWGATQPDWIAICYNKALEILLVPSFNAGIQLTGYMVCWDTGPYIVPNLIRMEESRKDDKHKNIKRKTTDEGEQKERSNKNNSLLRRRRNKLPWFTTRVVDKQLVFASMLICVSSLQQI
uniref:Uncharacterized protein n=1 Tax=Timema poppense TaxID=170557 RepID=A0A7R9H4U1_TIMPO|nr:unnamed protein product [Timema poppensis]